MIRATLNHKLLHEKDQPNFRGGQLEFFRAVGFVPLPDWRKIV